MPPHPFPLAYASGGGGGGPQAAPPLIPFAPAASSEAVYQYLLPPRQFAQSATQIGPVRTAEPFQYYHHHHRGIGVGGGAAAEQQQHLHPQPNFETESVLERDMQELDAEIRTLRASIHRSASGGARGGGGQRPHRHSAAGGR